MTSPGSTAFESNQSVAQKAAIATRQTITPVRQSEAGVLDLFCMAVMIIQAAGPRTLTHVKTACRAWPIVSPVNHAEALANGDKSHSGQYARKIRAGSNDATDPRQPVPASLPRRDHSDGALSHLGCDG